LIDRKIFGATFGIGGAIAPIAPWLHTWQPSFQVLSQPWDLFTLRESVYWLNGFTIVYPHWSHILNIKGL